VKAAGSVLASDLASKNANSGGKSLGGLPGGFVHGATGHLDTEIGQVISPVYLDAYTKRIEEFKNLPDNASASNEVQAVTMTKPGQMYVAANGRRKVVRTLDSGMVLFPTGEKEGMLREVADELGNKGWVSSVTRCLPSRMSPDEM